MQYPYYSNPKDFSPSIATLNDWLKTRKSNSDQKPGLFETIDYSRDTLWATIAIFIELSAMILTIYGASIIFKANHKLPTIISAVIIVLLFIAFDIIGILLHGQDKPEKVIIRSRIKIEQNATERRFLNEKLKQITWRTFFGIILLSFSGILKIVAITLFFKGIAPPGVAVLVLFYLVVIYIHIFHTGYWLSARGLKKSIDKEHRLWHGQQQDTFKAIQHTKIFESPVPMDINMTSIHNGRQQINFLEKKILANGATVFTYELLSEGCLWDEEVVSLIAPFNSGFSGSLLNACIAMQFSQLGKVF